MPVQITVRNVPEEVRDRLAERAAAKRQSMQQYLLSEFEQLAAHPSKEEVLASIREHKAAYNVEFSIEEILEARDADRT